MNQYIMAHKTFISYKYSEAVDLRNRIIKAMGEDAVYYNGEHGFSPNKSDCSNNTIWDYLKQMIWGTSVTIVIISPHMKESSWIESELKYSLKQTSHNGTQSKRNGMVAVIMNDKNRGYEWFKSSHLEEDGHCVYQYCEELVFDIIVNNRYNQTPKKYCCQKCKSISAETGSYISYVEEEDFLANVNDYVEKAFQKSQNDASGYEIKIETKNV